MPSVEGLTPDIRDHNDGSISVEYKPIKGGVHEVQMIYEGAAVQGSPFSCIVDQVDNGYVTAFGAGLLGGMSGQMAHFTLVAKAGTLGSIDIRIDGPTKVDIKRVDKGDKCDVSYMPMTPGAYNIVIRYKGKEIKGSPFVAKVSGEGRKRSQLSLGNTCEYDLGVSEPDIVDLNGSLHYPDGKIEPCVLKKLSDGKLAIASFSPTKTGKHQVHVIRQDKNIKGSPFNINVSDKEMAHASKVRVSGPTTEAKANSSNVLTIDTSDAGYGGLSVVIEGPHRSEVELQNYENNVYQVEYSPHEPGIYILNIRYANEHIQGSPFLLNVSGDPSGRVRETLTKEMAQAEPVKKGQQCELILKIPGTNPFDMEASVTDPDGSTEVCEIMDEEDSHYKIFFTPAIEGLHTLSIKHKGMHTSGSPFQYSVGQLSSGGPHKVQVGGPGLERGETNTFNDFNIYTREAGAGELTVSIEGPGESKLKLEDRPNGFLGVSYSVSKPGMYGLHVKFCGEHIPNSPFMVHVSPDSAQAKEVTVHALKDRGLKIDKACTFTVSYNGAAGQLNAHIRTPSGGHEDCFVQKMDEGLYALRFVPRENGVHFVDIKLNDHHIPDSPFAILVGSTAADPAMVCAYGDGLENGKTNLKNKFVVRTTGAGSGLLAVYIDGPSKTALSCRELDEGYEFSYTPFAPGKYLITIKYGNIDIAGSPYASTVVGAGRKPSPVSEQTSMVVETVEKKGGVGGGKRFRGDASKVRVGGPGLKKAMTGRLLAVNVDVKDAGHALLTVGMIGPNGLPEPELSVRKNTATAYTVSYKVIEQGEHTLVIKWGDEDVPGSPFCLHS